MKTETLKIEIPNGFQIDSFDETSGVVKFKEIPKNIIDQIKNFDDVLKYHGINDFQGAFMFLGSPDEMAYRKLKLIVSALNEGWEPNWDNSNERKYFPYFKMASGGFSSYGCDNWAANSTVGSRLCFKSAELARYAAETFTDIYKEFFIIKK